jgi:hypothetical protein
MAPIISKPTTTTTAANNNGHGPYTCNHCHKVFEHKLELNLHVAALHNSGEFSFFQTMVIIFLFLEVKIFSNNDEDVEVDDDEEDDIEDEQSYEKDEDMSDTSEQNIDLLED